MEQVAGMLTKVKAEQLESFFIKGQPNPEDYEHFKKLADKITEKINEIN